MSQSEPDPRSVFVVHGRNNALRNAMFEFLRSLDLSPMEWAEAVALTGKGSPYIGEVLDLTFSNARAIVVLMTPDEVAYLDPRYAGGEDDPDTTPASQARPNVLFEAGMALGRSSERTILVEVGTMRPFSDVAGRHAIRMSNDATSRQQLALRLITAGCPAKQSATDWLSAGDFTPPEPPGDGLPLGRRVPPRQVQRPEIDFAARYIDKGSRRLGKLQVTNRGVDDAHNVTLSVDPDTALDLSHAGPIELIPGGGHTVTVDALDKNRMLGAGARSAFHITIEAQTPSGKSHSQRVFMEMNG